MKKGITLISLVITIIIMLILAGVGISGSLALIEQAKYAAFANEMKQADEAVYLVIMEGQLEQKTTEEILADIGERIPEEVLEKISNNLKLEILYARDGFPEGRFLTNYDVKDFEKEESLNSLFLVNASVAGKEQAYIYDEQSASVYKVEATIIWGVEMHGYDYGNLLVSRPGLLEKAQGKDNSIKGDVTIYNLSDWNKFVQDGIDGETYAGKTVTLNTDINLEGQTHTPIPLFEGTFEGNNNTISNLTITNTVNYTGLFAQTNNTTIKNLNISNVNVQGTSYVGGIVGNAQGSTVIENISLNGSIQSSYQWSGGMVGYCIGSSLIMKNCNAEVFVICNSSSSSTGTGGLTGYISCVEVLISDCYVTGSITTTGSGYNWATGGIAGEIGFGHTQTGTYTEVNHIIQRCYVIASITGRGNTGGLYGSSTFNQSKAIPYNLTIEDCFVQANVSGTTQVGGFIACLQKLGSGSFNAQMNRNYYAGKVSGSSYVGAFVGFNYSISSVVQTNCYFDKTISGTTSTLGNAVGKTTTELQTPSTFANWPTDVWNIEEGKYPTLKSNNNNSALLESGYIDDGLVLYYDGINNIGNSHNNNTSTWLDLSGNGNHGSLKNFNGNHWDGNGLTFDGTDDYVTTEREMNYENITIEAIVQYNAEVTDEVDIVNNYQSGGYGLSSYGAAEITDKDKNGIFVNIGETYYCARSDETIKKDVKYILSGTYDGNTIKFWENSVKYETEQPGSITFPINNTVMMLGTNPSGITAVSGYLNGKIYCVRIYNRALTEQEIKHNYEIDKARFGIE